MVRTVDIIEASGATVELNLERLALFCGVCRRISLREVVRIVARGERQSHVRKFLSSSRRPKRMIVTELDYKKHIGARTLSGISTLLKSVVLIGRLLPHGLFHRLMHPTLDAALAHLR